jgi:hypothetical protein
MDDDIEILASGLVKSKRDKKKVIPLTKKKPTKKKSVKSKPLEKDEKKSEKTPSGTPAINIVVNVPKTERKKKEKKENLLNLSKPILDKGYKSSKKGNKVFDYTKRNIYDLSKPLLLQNEKDNKDKTLDFFNTKLEEYIDIETKRNGKSVKLLTKKLFRELYNKALVDTNLNGYKISYIPLQSELYNKYDSKLVKDNYENIKKYTEDIFYDTIDKFIKQEIETKKLDPKTYVRISPIDYKIPYDKTRLELELSSEIDENFIPSSKTLRELYATYDKKYVDEIEDVNKRVEKVTKDIRNEILNYLDAYRENPNELEIPEYIKEMINYSVDNPNVLIPIKSDRNPIYKYIPIYKGMTINDINILVSELFAELIANDFINKYMPELINKIKEIVRIIDDSRIKVSDGDVLYTIDIRDPNYKEKKKNMINFINEDERRRELDDLPDFNEDDFMI